MRTVNSSSTLLPESELRPARGSADGAGYAVLPGYDTGGRQRHLHGASLRYEIL
jgi:hypothetical protein